MRYAPPMPRKAPAAETLTTRRLNRATLARQMLLARERVTPEKAIERLAGMQAQVARPPYVGLWTRLEGFRRADLSRALEKRRVVRATFWRATLHLLSARDYLALRASIQPGLTRIMQGIVGARAQGIDLDGLVAEARGHLAKQPLTFDALRALLERRSPKADVLRALGYAVRLLLPLVQVPDPGSPWGFPAAADFTLADAWLGEPIDPAEHPRELVRRYLGAFGPATPADAQGFSGVQKLRPVFEEMRSELVTFTDERGRELFDLPKAPRPPEDTPAPARFLPDFDNLVLAHEDRTRVVADAHRPFLYTKNLLVPGSFLVDGAVAGTWKIERARRRATLTMRPFGRLSAAARRELDAEAQALLAFVEEDAEDRVAIYTAPQ
jgi:hypothetical protein